ncbi:MAG TPA: type III-A CRISPR-associated protein Cas10/Csm1 [Microscillaceae bacterium]|nr:type III-A CRISPR-associated protein Cas10/Csm1 [Microscillaceae bacterium]
MRNSQIYIDSIFKGLTQLFGDRVAQVDKFAMPDPQSQTYIEQATQYLGIGDIQPQEERYLMNIFEKIYPPVNQPVRYFDLKPLSIAEERFFPTATPQGKLSVVADEFAREYPKVPKGSLDTLYHLLKKHLSFVPVNTNKPYINAFEFLKLRSAFAQCLHDYAQHRPQETDQGLQFLMLCVDISGIQSFIYNIASGKAAKSLKGRSFYLQLLMDSLIQRILRDTQAAGFQTSIGHTIYASGGKAYLLLPNCEEVKQCIQKLEKEAEINTYAIHAESLYVLMDFVEFGYEVSPNSSKCKIKVGEAAQALISAKKETDAPLEIADLWTILGDKTAQKKQKKYQDLLVNKFEDFFGHQDSTGHQVGIGIGYDFSNKNSDIKTCAVTGRIIESPTKHQNVLNPEDLEADQVWVLESVKKQAELGKDLKSTEFYATYQGSKALSEKAQFYTIDPIDLKVFNSLKNEDNFVEEYDRVGSFKSLRHTLLRRINHLDFLNTIKEKETAYGFTFYGGNIQALKTNNRGKTVEKEYSDLADFSVATEGKGFHRLGVLRMDVDGLGGLFANDMQAKFGRESLQNFPAYAMVSSLLDTFYAGYLNTLRAKDKYRDWVNILYSGGDDVFAIGRWDLVLDFAHEIQQKFKAYAGARPTLSAGVALITPKFPISKGADMAGDAEHNAKKFKYEIVNEKGEKEHKEKNAIAFFGEVVGWHQEFEKVKNIRDQLLEFDGVISASFRQKLIRFQATKNKHAVANRLNDQANIAPDLSYKWQSAYFISQLAKELNGKNNQAHATLLNFKEDLHGPEERYLKTLKNQNVHYDKAALQEFLRETQKDLFVADRNFDLYAIAARWAGLLLRNKHRNSLNEDKTQFKTTYK